MTSLRKKHRWTISDDVVALYLYRFGDKNLAIDKRKIAEILNIGYGSLVMRISNFKSIDNKSGLDHFAQQSADVYDKYGNYSEEELKVMVEKALRNV
jgi:hypothetical protein